MGHNNCGHGCRSCGGHAGGQNKALLRQAVSFVMLVAGVAAPFVGLPELTGVAAFVWYAAAFLPVGLPVMKAAAESLRRKEFFNEFTLMLIASAGAFVIGEYPEAVAVMLFYSVGEMMQDKAVGRARKNIRALVDIRPETAVVVRDGQPVEVAPDKIMPGEEIEVKPGGRVPLDGVLLGEKSTFDTSALTGESVPRRMSPGDTVLAGMISADRVVRLKVVRPFADSALSRILSMVEDAAERKAPTELFIRRFSRVYTPVVVLLALLIVGVPYVVSQFAPFDYVFDDWLYRGLVFLVISCPCALVVSVPLGYFGGIGAASRLGILFKGGNYVDAVAKLKAVAFDKTGTLTQGVFEVTEIVTGAGFDERGLLGYVASAERGSTHPIAKAVAEKAKSEGVDVVPAKSVEELPGYGLRAETGGKTVLAGNVRLMEKNGVAVPPELAGMVGTIVCCAVDGVFAGSLLLSDREKPDVEDAFRRLRSEGVERLAIFSGDRQPLVSRFGERLGVAEAYGDLLPADKVERFRRFKAETSGAVAFVGDGINDAPVLAMSDVGFAMGELGSDAAVETADVVIATDSPSRIADAVRVGRITGRVVRQNIVLSIGVKVAVMILGAVGFANLWAAVFADVGVALLAIFNALRIQRLVGDKKKDSSRIPEKMRKFKH